MREVETIRDDVNGGMLAALEPDQLVAAKKKPLPRRALSFWETCTLWILRLYLIGVMGILLYQVINR
jgi:hypothetical protein